jgi:DNA-binding MurR/RpiR family transcriptional regulator
VLFPPWSIDAQTQLKVVAAEAKVSEAMVTKIAKKLGFDGFRSLRTALAEYNRLPVTEIRQELCGYPTIRDIVKKNRPNARECLGRDFFLALS